MKRIPLRVVLIFGLGVVCPAAGADKPQIVELWPGTAPDETGTEPRTVRFTVTAGLRFSEKKVHLRWESNVSFGPPNRLQLVETKGS
jgi:hypothetical protein